MFPLIRDADISETQLTFGLGRFIEQQAMNPPRRRLEFHTPEAVQVVLMAVDFGTHAPG